MYVYVQLYCEFIFNFVILMLLSSALLLNSSNSQLISLGKPQKGSVLDSPEAANLACKSMLYRLTNWTDYIYILSWLLLLLFSLLIRYCDII